MQLPTVSDLAMLFGPIAWPITVIIALLAFRSQLTSLVGRITKVGRDGISISATAETDQERVASSADQLLNAFANNPLLLEREQLIQNDLAAVPDNESRIAILTRHLAATQIGYLFEFVNARIWASQINFLNALNHNSSGLNIEDVKPYIEIAAGGHADILESMSVEEYTQMLIANNLVQRTGNTFWLTGTGREFLVFLVHNPHTGPKFM